MSPTRKLQDSDADYRVPPSLAWYHRNPRRSSAPPQTIFDPSREAVWRVPEATRNSRQSGIASAEHEEMRAEAAAAGSVREAEQKRIKQAALIDARRVEEEAAAAAKVAQDQVHAEKYFAKTTKSEAEPGAGFESGTVATQAGKILRGTVGYSVPEVAEEFIADLARQESEAPLVPAPAMPSGACALLRAVWNLRWLSSANPRKGW
ncbi:hypothetical protein C8R46DRAFT_1281562 [Mycena filopes]|nr:hypothetical protein C8R46DRAFT_1281562 [Mycena filopes]